MVNRNMDNFGSEDMSIPNLTCIQNLGADEAKAAGAKPGQFYFSLTGEIIPGDVGVNFIIADIIKTRTYWGRDQISADAPVCSSQNANTGIGTNDQGEQIKCATCPHLCEAPWLLTGPERRKKCTTSFILLSIRATPDRSPFMIRAGGISSKSVRDLITVLKMNRLIAGKFEKALVNVKSSYQKTASGEAYAMIFKNTALLDDVKAASLLKDIETLLGNGTALAAPPEHEQLEAGTSAPPWEEAPPPSDAQRPPVGTVTERPLAPAKDPAAAKALADADKMWPPPAPSSMKPTPTEPKPTAPVDLDF
jgi:hypothetical protein